MRSRNSG